MDKSAISLQKVHEIPKEGFFFSVTVICARFVKDISAKHKR
jgi:hypothetical protein